MGTTQKSSLQIANLLAKLQNKAKNSKMDNPIDQIVKGTEGYYIIFSGKKIFKTVNVDDIGLENIKDLVNNKINLTDTNYFLQVQLNDIKNDISNIEIMSMYPEYNDIRRVIDGQNNEIIVGIKPGEIDNLTSSVPGEDKQYIKKVNHLFIADDVMHLLNTDSGNIIQAELEMMKKFENTGNLDVDEHLASDFIQDSKVTKSEVLTYNSITLEGDPIIYGNYTYKQYKITDSKNESHYIIYQIENSNPENIKEIYSSTKKMLFLVKDEIICVIDHEVFDESDGYPVNKEMLLIYPTGEIKESTITYFSTIGVYGECTYKQYVIDGLSECYAVLGWKTSDPHNPYIVIRSDSWIYSTEIINVGRIFVPYTDFDTQKSFYTVCANTSGTISTPLVNYRLSLYDYIFEYMINGTYFFWQTRSQTLFHQTTWMPTILEFDADTSEPNAYLFNMANLSSNGTYACKRIDRYYILDKQLVLSLINSSFISFWKTEDTNKKYFAAPGGLKPGEINSINEYVDTSTYNVSAYTDTRYILFFNDYTIWNKSNSNALFCKTIENNDNSIRIHTNSPTRSNASKKIHSCIWDWWWGAALLSSRQKGDHTVTANVVTCTISAIPFTIETITSATNNYDLSYGSWHWGGDNYDEGGSGGGDNGPNCSGHCRYYPNFNNLMTNHSNSKDLYKKYKVTRTDTSTIQYTSHNHSVTLTNVQ